MLSNLIITQHKFILFVDNIGIERYSDKVVSGLFKEQGQNKLLILPGSIEYHLDKKLRDLNKDVVTIREETVVILQPLSLLLNVYKLNSIFNCIHKLRKDANVRQTFLWATTKNLASQIAVPFLEHLADVIVTIVDATQLTIVSRKQGGAVTNKRYEYWLQNGSFHVKELKKFVLKAAEPEVKHETTFKIELEEDEVIARNAVKLPYERVSEAAQSGQILYVPDANDDFDEEDPDDDLNF